MKRKSVISFLILCLSLLPALGLCEELTAFADSWRSDMNPLFEETYPNVTVRNSLDAPIPISFDQMLVGLLTGESGYDLFYLRYSSGKAKALSDRGYLADLGQSDAIRESVAGMPEVIRQRVTAADGSIFAFPCVLETEDRLMGFNTEVAERLGIQKPETYAEFFDLLARWDSDYEAQAEAAGLCLVDYAFDWIPWRFLSQMIDRYIAGYPDEALRYDTPEFISLMRLYDQYREMLSGLQESIRDPGNGQPWKRALFVYDLPLLMDFDEQERYGGIEPMPLSVTDDPADTVIPVNLRAFSVYGDTPRLALALRYVACRAEGFTPAERILFQGGSDDTPVEHPNYAWQMAFYNAAVQALEASLEAESDEELEAELTQYRLEREDCAYRRYLYTAESIRSYASLTPRLRPMPPVSYDYYVHQPNLKVLLDGFTLGEISVEDFVREFDHVQMMMNLEAQY